MQYIEYLNQLIRNEVMKTKHPVLFGQNINAGSCLGGLTCDMVVGSDGRIINTINAENTLVGFGFGLMLGGAQGVFFMKQMDFLLLGIDQLVNTYNIIRSVQHQPKTGSFTIVAMVVDSGYEGPQSSLNNFGDFCSIARIPGFVITNKTDADYLIPKHLMQPGFRIIGLSQRLGRKEIIDPGMSASVLGGIVQYTNGEDATVVSFNFSFPQAQSLCQTLAHNGINAAHFNVNSALTINWSPIIKSVSKTKKIIVVDDSKSAHIPADSLLAEFVGTSLQKKIVIRRELGDNWLYPTSDLFEINENQVLKNLEI